MNSFQSFVWGCVRCMFKTWHINFYLVYFYLYQFTAHPHTQQLLSTIWYEGLPYWRGSNLAVKCLICASVFVCMPFLAVYYLIFPRSRIGSMLRSPFMKFMNHSASFIMFLILLVLASTRFLQHTTPEEANKRGAAPGEIEIIVLIFAFGE